jgi:hypothetical protein
LTAEAARKEIEEFQANLQKLEEELRRNPPPSDPGLRPYIPPGGYQQKGDPPDYNLDSDLIPEFLRRVPPDPFWRDRENPAMRNFGHGFLGFAGMVGGAPLAPFALPDMFNNPLHGATAQALHAQNELFLRILEGKASPEETAEFCGGLGGAFFLQMIPFIKPVPLRGTPPTRWAPKYRLLDGSGPAPGLIEASPYRKMAGALKGWNKKVSIEFVFDPVTERLVIGKAPKWVGGLSPHEKIVMAMINRNQAWGERRCRCRHDPP